LQFVSLKFGYPYSDSLASRLAWISDYLTIGYIHTGNGVVNNDPDIQDYLATVAGLPIGQLQEVEQLIASSSQNGSLVLSDLLNAQSINNQINPGCLLESYLQQVNAEHIAGMLDVNYQIGGNSMSVLQDIAWFCALTYGPPVYRARALLSDIDTTQYLDLNCDESFVQLKQDHSTGVELPYSCSIQPVPAREYINFQYQMQEGDKGIFGLTDLAGRKLMDIGLNESNNSLQIDVSQVPEGLYLWRFRVNSRTIEEGKLIIGLPI